jgi:hypothetical protein
LTRALVAFCALVIAFGAGAQDERLLAGPEMPIGSIELGEWPLRGTPALATSGDEMLAVMAAWGNLYALRLDRHGRPLETVPAMLLQGTVDVDGSAEIHLFWHRGVYLVFFTSHRAELYALRVTPDLGVLDLTLVANDVFGPIDIASDGEEFVVVPRARALLRLGGDLSVRQAIPLEQANARTVAWANGRYAVVTLTGFQIAVQFLEDGILGPRTVLAAINNYPGGGGAADVAWTGSEFALIWNECVDGDCLISRLRFTAAGVRTSELRPIVYEPPNLSTDRLAVIPLGDGVVLYRWDFDTAWGRRYRGDVPLDPAPVAFGLPRLAAIRTAHDVLVTLDAVMRVSTTPAPAVTPLAGEVALTHVTATGAHERTISAAATATEIAIIRQRTRRTSSLVALILGRDGAVKREFPIEGRSATVATDGSDFFVVSEDLDGSVWFSRLGEGAPRVFLDRDRNSALLQPRLVWTGHEFIVYRFRRLDFSLWLQRVSRDGSLNGEPFTLPVRGHDSAVIIRRGDELLLTWASSRENAAQRLSLQGVPLEEPQRLPSTPNPPAAAWNGRAEAYLVVRSIDDAGFTFALRPPGKTLSIVTAAGGQTGFVYKVSLVAAGSYFIGFYSPFSMGRARAVLLDENGLVDELTLDGVRVENVDALVPLGPNRVLALYTRRDLAAPNLGAERAFARVLTIAHGRPR